MESNTTQTPQVAPLAPTDGQREVAKSRMQEVIIDWLDVRINEVFQMSFQHTRVLAEESGQ